MGWACNTHGRYYKCIQILVGNFEGRARRRWKDNFIMDVRELGWEDVD